MLGQRLQSMVDGIDIDNPKEDKKSAKRVGQYKISSKAIYKADATYLPIAAIKDVTHDRTSVHVSGCCAGGIWVERLVFGTEAGRFSFIFDSKNEIEKLKEISGLLID